jgi:hypothetical protein
VLRTAPRTSQMGAGAPLWPRRGELKGALARLRCLGAACLGSPAGAAELDPGPCAGALGVAVDEPRGSHVLHRQAQRLEESHLVGVSPAGVAVEHDLAELGLDVVVADRSLAPRDEDVAGLVEGGLTPRAKGCGEGVPATSQVAVLQSLTASLREAAEWRGPALLAPIAAAR